MTAVDSPIAALERLEDASLSLLEGRLLQTRVDRKFVMPLSQLPIFLGRLSTTHRVLRAAGAPAATYETCYFDTADRRMYDDHRRGRRPRYKVRVRHQLERQLTFVEIKKRGHDGRTRKARLPRPFGDMTLDEEARAFLAAQTPFDPDALAPSLWVNFRRATVLATEYEERLTIDWTFAFTMDAQELRWNRIAIVEIKQPRYHHDSPAVRALREFGLREDGLSKYCVGSAKLAPVRGNIFFPTIRNIERLSV